MSLVRGRDNNNDKYNKNGAGNGNFVLPPHIPEREGKISNPHVLLDMGLANFCSATLFQDFERYLRTQNGRNVMQILSYARRYAAILETGDASQLFLSKHATVRRHAMESLTVLSEFIGCYDRWQQIRNPDLAQEGNRA